MYIEPSTIIKICRNVPIDKGYNNTLYFESKNAQYTYFNSTRKYEFNNQSFQRARKGAMRVQVASEDIFDCNYLMFNNTRFGNKWFYAFITNIEYINNACCEIEYEIDAIQTYLFDVELKECFVEREHTLTDEAGEHILPENVSLGEYVYTDYEPISNNLTNMYVIIAIVDRDGGNVGLIYDNTFSGASLWAFKPTDVAGIVAKLESYQQKPEAIVSMYMCPKICFSTLFVVQDGGTKVPNHTTGNIGFSFTLPKCNANESLDGYLPKNKKLYTYPYNFLQVDNASGSTLALRYEFFGSGNGFATPILTGFGTITQPIKVTVQPSNYKGIPSALVEFNNASLFTESITLENYPTCTWNNDSYLTFMSQQMIPMLVQQGTSLTGFLASDGKGGNPLGVISSQLTKMYNASIQADTSRGNFNNGGVRCASGKQNFYCARTHITYQYAKMIDEYFDMFGYTVNMIKKPNISSRPHWNYTKTVDCICVGDAPADDIEKICNIYNNGIRFWKNANDVGNYGLNNTPSNSIEGEVV